MTYMTPSERLKYVQFISYVYGDYLEQVLEGSRKALHNKKLYAYGICFA